MFTRSIYCTLFLLDCFDFAYECTCICVYSVTLFIVVINLCYTLGFCNSVALSSPPSPHTPFPFFLSSSFFFLFSFFIILIFNFLNPLYFFYIYFFVCLSFCSFPFAANISCIYVFSIYLYLTLHTYSFILCFLSFLLNIFVSFVFIALFPTWYLALVLFSALCFT